MAEAPAILMDMISPPVVKVPGDDTPVKTINGPELRLLAGRLGSLFTQYRSDRRIQELRWTRNLRQYLGIYDEEIERYLTPDRSKAYPKITRVKCISMLSRIMDLMFPSDDKNWTIAARPSADMDIEDVKKAVADMVALDTDANGGTAPVVDDQYVQAAVQALAEKRADALSDEVKDQLQELGGDQSYDYVALNKEVVASGIVFGIGSLLGPYARPVKTSSWKMDPKTNQPVAVKITTYMPQFEFLRCWDYYPDLSAKRLEDGDGYFVRRVMSKRQLRDLADREDFFGDTIKYYLRTHATGNYKAQEFETELRSMGTKININEQKPNTTKYEIIVWHGPIDGHFLQAAGADVPDSKLSDQIDAEVWMVEDFVIKAAMNPWVELKEDVKTCHSFVFDQDDTSPIGFGLPNIMRDTQMSISAATRMMMDNASVVCGPILEVNTSLLRTDQDVTSMHAYKTYYRDDSGSSAQFEAVRQIKVDSNIDELEQIIKLFLTFADMETFVSQVNGGDMPSEPMRNAAGASMLMGHAALPFKDIIRNFDRFTQSVIQSIVSFNRAVNPTKAPTAEFDVVARGATSLIAKELRSAQLDAFVSSMTDDEKLHVDMRALVSARLAVRDLQNILVSPAEADRRQQAQSQAQQVQQDQAQKLAEATIRKLLSDAFKNIAQANKNAANANASAVTTALSILESGNDSALTGAKTLSQHAQTAQTLAQTLQPGQGADGGPDAGDQGAGGAAPAPDPGGPGGPDLSGAGGTPQPPGGPGGPGLGLLPPSGSPLVSSQGPGAGAPA